MPLPKKFYLDGEETSLDMLCIKEPSWAASRIRALHKQIDGARESHQAKVDFMRNQIADLLAYIKKLKAQNGKTPDI